MPLDRHQHVVFFGAIGVGDFALRGSLSRARDLGFLLMEE
jgi:hypothetical protein